MHKGGSPTPAVGPRPHMAQREEMKEMEETGQGHQAKKGRNITGALKPLEGGKGDERRPARGIWHWSASFYV